MKQNLKATHKYTLYNTISSSLPFFFIWILFFQFFIWFFRFFSNSSFNLEKRKVKQNEWEKNKYTQWRFFVQFWCPSDVWFFSCSKLIVFFIFHDFFSSNFFFCFVSLIHNHKKKFRSNRGRQEIVE